MKKILFIISLSFFVLGSMYPTQADAGWLEFFFPSLKDTSDDPSKTLQAPFAKDPDEESAASQIPAAPGTEANTDAADLEKIRELVREPGKVLNQSTIPLHLPHWSSQKVNEWVITAASEALTFDDDVAAQDSESTKGYFSTLGRTQYQEFLEEKKIQNVINSNKYHIRSYVKETPLLLNEGAVGGSYKWLYQVPVMVSYMKRGMKTYKNAEALNQQMTLTLQIGRVAAEDKPDGIVIERWSGKVDPMEKQ